MANEVIDTAESNCERDDETYLAWTCALVLGMFHPAQFEAIVSRFYLGMTVTEEAHWMSCSVRNAKKINTRAIRNMKIIAEFIKAALETKDA